MCVCVGGGAGVDRLIMIEDKGAAALQVALVVGWLLGYLPDVSVGCSVSWLVDTLVLVG